MYLKVYFLIEFFIFVYFFPCVYYKINIVKHNCVILVVKNHLYTYLL